MLWCQGAQKIGLCKYKLKSALKCTVWSQCMPVPDRQTDGQTNIMAIVRHNMLKINEIIFIVDFCIAVIREIYIIGCMWIDVELLAVWCMCWTRWHLCQPTRSRLYKRNSNKLSWSLLSTETKSRLLRMNSKSCKKLVYISQSLSLHSNVSLSQVHLLEFDHTVFGSHRRW